MDHDLVSTLRATGYISHAQLLHHFAATVPPLSLEAWMLQTRDGLWDAAQYRKGGHLRHWVLRTDIFLKLAPTLEHWQVTVESAAFAYPDALLTVTGQPYPIALEADTAKETKDQWRVKLDEYINAPADWHILVVAQGKKLRVNRLYEWLADFSPRPWLLIPANSLWDPWAWEWQDSVPKRATFPTASPIPQSRYSLAGHLIPADIAENLLQSHQARICGCERQHSVEIHYLVLTCGR